MSESTSVMPSPHRAKPPRARRLAIMTAAGCVALLAVACSSGTAPSARPSGSASSGGSAAAQLIAFSRCMRSDGVPTYPDPIVNGGVTTLPKESAQHLGVSGSQFTTAERACQHLLPHTGSLTASSLQQCYLADVCPPALVQDAMNAGRQFAGCMRSHGAPTWPDPTIDGEGRPLYNITVPRPPPPRVAAAINQCSRLDHAGSLLAWG
jgi:hypothetical protein